MKTKMVISDIATLKNVCTQNKIGRKGEPRRMFRERGEEGLRGSLDRR